MEFQDNFHEAFPAAPHQHCRLDELQSYREKQLEGANSQIGALEGELAEARRAREGLDEVVSELEKK